MWKPNFSRRSIRTLSVSLLLLVCFLGHARSDEQRKNPDLWKWTSDSTHLWSVVKITVNGSEATGVVIEFDDSQPIQHESKTVGVIVDEDRTEGQQDGEIVKEVEGFDAWVLTAYHVVDREPHADRIEVVYRDGTRAKATLRYFDEQHDLALLQTWAPKGTRASSVANSVVKHRMYLEFAGLGGGADLNKSMRHFWGRATQPTNDDFIYADETLLPGDSGGPVFNSRLELVGIISGGWFWWDAGIHSKEGHPVLSTWPARASNLQAIRKLLAKRGRDSEKLDGQKIARVAEKQE